MLAVFLIALALVGVTVALHAVGLYALIRAMVHWRLLEKSSMLPVTCSMMGLTFGLMALHFVDISLWGLFYSWQDCVPDLKDALYFSGVTYTTLGYGDFVLSKTWRMLAPIETLTGILMCGLSTGIFFAAVSRWISNRRQGHTQAVHHAG